MTNKEIERYKQEIGNILNREEHKEKVLGKMYSDLVLIAGKVGAVKYPGASTFSNLVKLYDKASLPEERCDLLKVRITEIVYNINDALRIETMINCSKTASGSLIVSVIASIVACVSAVAAWFAVTRN